MLRDTGRPARLAAALQWDRGRWLWLLLILLLLAMVLALGDTVDGLLRYDRGAIAAGGWWRLLTAHLVHLDAHHLILNELGLVLMWALFAGDFDATEWLAVLFVGALAITSGLWWLSPRVAWYVGASGLLHTVMGAGTAKHLIDRNGDGFILLAGLAIKLSYEHLTSPAPGIVAEAHLYGAVSGLAVGAAFGLATAILRHRSTLKA